MQAGPGRDGEQIGTRACTDMQAGPLRYGGSGRDLRLRTGQGAPVQAGRPDGSPWWDGSLDGWEDFSVWQPGRVLTPGIPADGFRAAGQASQARVRRRYRQGVR